LPDTTIHTIRQQLIELWLEQLKKIIEGLKVKAGVSNHGQKGSLTDTV
jgi:hypothetical protein